MALKPMDQVVLWPGDDRTLSWEDRIAAYAEHINAPYELADHLASIERGVKQA